MFVVFLFFFIVFFVCLFVYLVDWFVCLIDWFVGLFVGLLFFLFVFVYLFVGWVDCSFILCLFSLFLVCSVTIPRRSKRLKFSGFDEGHPWKVIMKNGEDWFIL